MPKTIEKEEEVKDLFGGFDLLNQTTPKAIVKKKEIVKEETKEEETEDDKDSETKLDASKTESKLDNKEETKDVDKKDIKEPSKEEEKTNPFLDWVNFLKDENVLDVDDEDVVESEKDLIKLQNKTINNGINKYKESIPEDGRKFLEFVENGGKPADFHKYYYGDSSFEDFNIDSVENQKYVIEEALKLEDYEEQDIKDQIELYEDTDKLASKAATHLKKLQKVEKEQKNLLLESQKTFAKQEEAKRIEDWDNFKKGLFDKETVGGFKLTPKVKDDLWNYMTKIVDKKTGETAYQKESNENPDSRYIYAYLLKNKWDISSLERMVESKKTSELKSKLSSFTDTRSKQKGPASKQEQEKDSEDYFSGFGKIFKQ